MFRFTRQAILTTAALLMSTLAVAQEDPDVAEGWEKIVPEPVTLDGKLYTPQLFGYAGHHHVHLLLLLPQGDGGRSGRVLQRRRVVLE
jgi:hypothetical protein